MVADTRQIFHAAAANDDRRVLLEIVPLTRDVGCHLHAVGKPHARDFSQSRVRLFGRCRKYFETDAALKRRGRKFRPILDRVELPEQSW